MEALSSSWYISAHLQSVNDGYLNMPCSLLVEEEQGLDSPFMPFSLLVEEQGLDSPSTPSSSSQSLEMEAALQHLSSSCESELSSSPNSFDDPDVLMVDPYLDYLNEILMEEDLPVVVQGDTETSYHAIMSSLYDIVGKHSPLDSTSSEDVSTFHLSRQFVSSHDPTSREDISGSHFSHTMAKISHYEQHIDISKPYVGLSSLTSKTPNLGVSRNLFPARDNFHVSVEQGKSEILSVEHEVEHNSFSQADAMARHHPLRTDHVSECGVIEDISDYRSNNAKKAHHQEQGTGNLNLLPSNNKSAPKSISVDVSFEDIKDEVGYSALYVGKPSTPSTSASTGGGSSLNGDKKTFSRAAAGKARKPTRKGSPEVMVFVDVREVLVSCAQAVAMGDAKRASEILQELYQVHGASVTGNGLQRTAHFFGQALLARMEGMGGQCLKIICDNMPSDACFLRASKLWFKLIPYLKIMHYFANQNILKAAEGARRLHIVDYGIFYGMQWPCLINALADREGGPPLLVFTGIEFPKPGQFSKLEESGRRLAAYARKYDVPFQFHPIVTYKWEDIDSASLHLQENEVLVVNCIKRLNHLLDEGIDSALTISPRQKLLMRMHSLNPHLLLIGEMNMACGSPFFVSRFREALYAYSNLLDMVDTIIMGDNSERMLIEINYWFHDILSIVACEGAERVVRLETFKQWDARIKRAGFELLPIPSVILSRSRSHVKQHYHKDFLVHDDANGWMLLGWKGRPLLAMSAWKPSLLL